MFLKKRCSYKQLFWKLPGEIFSQNLWKISLKKFVFSKVAQSRSWEFLPKKKTSEKHNFHKFLYKIKTSGNATESCRLSACNFTKNELLHRYFSRILTADFKTPIFQKTSPSGCFCRGVFRTIVNFKNGELYGETNNERDRCYIKIIN